MKAIHINWTKPFTARTNGEYYIEDFEILTTILSALKWRDRNGPIKMVTDSVGYEYYRAAGLSEIWDGGVEAALDDIDVNPNVFWAAGKIFALQKQKAPVAMVDTDFIVWERVDTNADAAVVHFEDLYSDVYPGREFFKLRDYEIDDTFDWSLKACNTALCMIKNEELLRYYTETAIEFMRHADENDERLKYMVFAEQRLIGMCAKKLGLKIEAFSDLGRLFGGEERRFTHTWGMKQQMRDNDALRFDFCRRCVDRIERDYPHMHDVMKKIDCLKRYY